MGWILECDHCGGASREGYRCTACVEYDLCPRCYGNVAQVHPEHPADHFIRFALPPGEHQPPQLPQPQTSAPPAPHGTAAWPPGPEQPYATAAPSSNGGPAPWGAPATSPGNAAWEGPPEPPLYAPPYDPSADAGPSGPPPTHPPSRTVGHDGAGAHPYAGTPTSGPGTAYAPATPPQYPPGPLPGSPAAQPNSASSTAFPQHTAPASGPYNAGPPGAGAPGAGPHNIGSPPRRLGSPEGHITSEGHQPFTPAPGEGAQDTPERRDSRDSNGSRRSDNRKSVNFGDQLEIVQTFDRKRPAEDVVFAGRTATGYTDPPGDVSGVLKTGQRSSESRAGVLRAELTRLSVASDRKAKSSGTASVQLRVAKQLRKSAPAKVTFGATVAGYYFTGQSFEFDVEDAAREALEVRVLVHRRLGNKEVCLRGCRGASPCTCVRKGRGARRCTCTAPSPEWAMPR